MRISDWSSDVCSSDLVLCVILPLSMVTLLGYALMVGMDIGQKVATLPVLAFACGIGVDYGIYSYTVVAAGLRKGLSLEEAYYQKMRSTGKATLITGIGLSVGEIGRAHV